MLSKAILVLTIFALLLSLEITISPSAFPIKVASGADASPAGTDPGYPKVCFYVDSPSTPLGSGHAFVQLLPSATSSKGFVYGFYPTGTSDIFGGTGVVQNDSSRSWDWKICYSVTAAQFNKMATFVNAQLKSPFAYALLSDNCVWWISKVAAAAGSGVITLPTLINRAGYYDPYAFESSLSSIGNGGTFSGGTVVQNTKGVPVTSSGDPPPECCSYDGIIEFGIMNTSATASNLCLSSNVDQLGTVGTIGVGASLNIDVSGGDLAHNIVFMNWGDGTNTTQSLDGTHSYSTAGSYNVQLLIMNNATIDLDNMTINVAGSGSGVTENFAAPAGATTNCAYSLNTPGIVTPQFPFGTILAISAPLAALALFAVVSRKRGFARKEIIQ